MKSMNNAHEIAGVGVPAEMCFYEGKGIFNRVEVGGVWRKILYANFYKEISCIDDSV